MREVINEIKISVPKFFSLPVNILTYFVFKSTISIVTFLKNSDLITNW